MKRTDGGEAWGEHAARGGRAHRLNKVASFHGAKCTGRPSARRAVSLAPMITLLTIALVAASAQDTTLAVIPRPVHMTRGTAGGAFTLTAGAAIVTDRATRDIGYQLADWLQPATGFRLQVSGSQGAATQVISLRLDYTLSGLGDE